MGLLYYGQNFLIYPSAFPAGARESAFTLCPLALSILTDMCDPPRFCCGLFTLVQWLDVPVPSDFSIPYTDLELTTPDNVKIRAFLLLQRHVLNMNEMPIEWDGQSKEDVRHGVPLSRKAN
jgi:hypothetical protein